MKVKQHIICSFEQDQIIKKHEGAFSKTLRLLVPKSATADLGPLVDAYYACGHCPEVDVYRHTPNQDDLVRMLDTSVDAVLFVSSARRSARTLVDGPFVKLGHKQIPIGLLALQSKESLAAFIRTMDVCAQRDQELLALALLSQRHPRYMRLVDRMHKSIGEDVYPLSWTSSDLVREDMLAALGLGLGLAVYFGHGRPSGWVGYYGLRAHHFDTNSTQPLGALLNLCCLTASRRKVGYSFAERLLFKGVTNALLAAVQPSLHTDNMRWAVGIAHALKAGARTLDELLVKAAPQQPSALNAYRIIGNPLAPITSSRSVLEQAINL